MLHVLELVTPLFALIGLGYLAGRWKKLPIEGLQWMNFFIIYIALPALFFQLLSKTPIEQFGNAAFIWRAVLATFLVFCLCFAIARLLRRDSTAEATIQGFAGAYGNIGYLGPPLALAAFGPAAVVPTALIFSLENAMHFILAPSLMALGGERQGSLLVQARRTLTNIISHPFIIATVVGMSAAALSWTPPSWADTLLQRLANAAAPCALFTMGVSAALRPLKRVPLELLWLAPIKLLLHPLLVWLLVSPLPGLDPIWLHTAVLMAALPAATNVFVLAQQYGVWEQRASSAVVLTTAISTVTITAYLALILGQDVPG